MTTADAAGEEVEISLTAARALIVAALRRSGADALNAGLIADVMIAAERDRAPSHGLFRAAGYCDGLVCGRVNGTARATLAQIAPAALRVDGDGGYAPAAQAVGVPALIDLARQTGVAALALRNTHHFAALWPEIEQLCAADLVGLAFTAALPMVAPAGATRPFFGTNPIAFGFPRAEAPPIVVDMATAFMARGDIALLARDGRAAPPGAGMDAEGQPTTDPAAILAGAQSPFGGHKGSALGLMVELLAGGLIGDVFSYEAAARSGADGGGSSAARSGPDPVAGGAPYGGELILAFDPERLAGPGWRAHASAFFEALAAVGDVRLPGARRWAARAAPNAETLRVPAALLRDLRARARD